MENFTPEFIQVPYQIFSNPKLTPLDGYLYGLIFGMTRLALKKCVASNETLAKILHISSGGIQNSLARLEKEGCIEKVFKDQERKKRLEIKCLIIYSKVSLNNDRVSLNDDRGVSLNNDHNIISTIENNNLIYIAPNGASIINKEKNQINELINEFKQINPSYRNFFSNKTQRNALDRLLKSCNFNELKQIISVLSITNQQDYAPVITTPCQLEDKFAQLDNFIKRRGSLKPVIMSAS